MWKGAAVFLLAALAIGWHLRYVYQGSVQIPKIPEEYWGPGRSVPDTKEIKPFKINVSKEVIDDLNQRLGRTREFAKPLEGVAWTYGISSIHLKKVLGYWRKSYDWSQRQTLLNKYPQFTTKIQGLDIHFYHVKPQLPKNRNIRVLPLLMVHGWPGSVVEFQKIIPLLTQVSAERDFVFEVIAPSLPGYGFSSPASKPGLGPAQVAVVFKNLMLRLGINTFYVQGGDWGSLITSILATLFPENVIGAHSNMCFVNAPLSNFLWFIGNYIPSLVVESEHQSKMYPISEKLSWLIEESGYFHLQATKPDTVGTGLSDSPAGLAAYILEKFSTWTNPSYKLRDDGGLTEKFSLDELLDNVMVYWVTNSITTSQRLYAEGFSKAHHAHGFQSLPVSVPSACAMFPYELMYFSETLLRQRYPKMIQFTHADKGGHFAAFEEPELLAIDIFTFVNKNEQQLKEEQRIEAQQQQESDQRKA
ncbi:hypothetical protein QAD02_008971 [Eretmocerus hayati]|uniref:Uncharacterized protein n=1 Tax=Eretmocerus hayati TaxID=131215 RepID=A0ACC2NAE7_9HYME|nr:hypothetical protein QAD02_008971 [Eretmocerus hayati]